MKLSMESLASTNAGHPPLNRKCSIVPTVGFTILHRGQMPALLDMSQCLVRDSTRALPDNHLDWMTALETSYGEEPHVVNKGCVPERDMKFGSKYFKDASLRRKA